MNATATSIESSMLALLKPISKSMTVDVAQALVKMRMDRQFQNRLDEVADKNTEGQLTGSERQECDHHLAALSFVTIMQSKARQKLSRRNDGRKRRSNNL